MPFIASHLRAAKPKDILNGPSDARWHEFLSGGAPHCEKPSQPEGKIYQASLFMTTVRVILHGRLDTGPPTTSTPGVR